jgi:hypothetical protein
VTVAKMRMRAALPLLAIGLLLAGCAMLDDTPPKPLPSVIATGYIGSPLLDLEMKWSTPWGLENAGGSQNATWTFDGYNLAGCKVTVHTDEAGIIRTVTWTPGCGPKGTGLPAIDPGHPQG